MNSNKISCKVLWRITFFVACSIMIQLCGCAEKQPQVIEKERAALILLSKSQYPKFGDDMMFDGLENAVSKSLEYLNKIPETREFRFGTDIYSAAHIKDSLVQFIDFVQKNPDATTLNRFIEENYRVYLSIGEKDTGKVLYTGYFEPALRGSRLQSSKYPYPVYGPPDDLITIDLSAFSTKYGGEKIAGRWNGKTVVPYYDREQIDFEQILATDLKPLVFVDNIVDLFFLHIQGSGRVFIDEGGFINLHYHSTNGRPYRSIGKYLIDTGQIERDEMSMQKIKEYLRIHPEKIQYILRQNPSYVFFEVKETGSTGALGVALTPGRSMAIDRSLFPDAALAFVETQKPLVGISGNISRWIEFSRFMLSQDTGGAIRGPGRADLFWGNGPYAEIAAGHMKHRGNLYFLVLKPDVTVKWNS